MAPYATVPLDINAPAPAVNMAESVTPYDISSDDKADLELVSRLISKGKILKKKWEKDWDKYKAYYDGNQWYGRKRPSYRASPSANIIRPTIQTQVPIMTDTSPKFDALPQDPTDYDFSIIVSKAIAAWWKKTGMQIKVVDWITDALKFGHGVAKVIWDKDYDNETGEIISAIIDPANIYVPDGAVDFEENCPWVIEMYPAQVGELKRKYPDKAEFIRPTGKRDKKSDKGADTQVYLVSPIDKDEGMAQPDAFGTVDNSDVVWCAECWIDDYAVEEIDKELEDGTIEKVTKRKYPLGKIIQCIPELKVHLATAENPYSDGKKPYVKLCDTRIPREFYAEGEIQSLIEFQDIMNKSMATMLDNMSQMTNPVWIVDDDSDVDPDMITNQIGAVIVKRKGSEVRREQAPTMPPQIVEIYNIAKNLADTASGVHDITQGRKPVGITAAEAINTMQEAAQTRIRLKERNLQTALEAMGRLWVSRMLQFYRTPRVVRITGNSNWPEYFEFFVEDVVDEATGQPTGKYSVNKKEFRFDNEANKYVGQPGYENIGTTKGVYDISVIAGTSLPFAKAQRGELAMKLVSMQQIDQEALLDALEWPNKEQVMQRMQENAEKQAQAQAAAQAQGQPQPMGR